MRVSSMSVVFWGFMVVFMVALAGFSGRAGSYDSKAFAVDFVKRASQDVCGVPGLSASDVRRGFEVESAEDRYNMFLGADVTALEVKVIEDFQAIVKHSEREGLISISPDSGDYIGSPKWDKSDDLYMESSLWKKMESYGDGYKETKVYYEKIGKAGKADKYRLRVRGEYTLSLEVGQKEKKVYFYQNDMALAGLETDKKFPQSLLKKNKQKWIKEMTSLAPLPEKGAALDSVDFTEWDKCGGGCNVQVVSINYKHMLGEGSNKTQYQGDYVAYMLNPKTGALFNYNRKWSNLP